MRWCAHGSRHAGTLNYPSNGKSGVEVLDMFKSPKTGKNCTQLKAVDVLFLVGPLPTRHHFPFPTLRRHRGPQPVEFDHLCARGSRQNVFPLDPN